MDTSNMLAMKNETESLAKSRFLQYPARSWGCRNTGRDKMYLLVVLILLLLHLLLLPLYLYLTWHHKYWRQRGVVTAKPLTLLGTYPGLLTRRSNLVEDVQLVYNKYRGKHRAVGVFVTRLPQILVLDPTLAREVLVGNFRCFKDSLTSSYMQHAKWDKYAKRNPFWASGDTWRRLRSEAKAGLSTTRLRQGYAIWEQSSRRLTAYMEYMVAKQGNLLETRDLCFRYAADVMCDFIWGIDAGTLTPEDAGQPNKVQQMATKWTTSAFYMISIFMASIVAPLSRLLLRMRFYPKDTDAFFSKLTMESVRLRLSADSKVDRTDFLSHLLRLRDEKNASHDDLVGHAMTVMLDGYDTTGSALMHALYYLSKYPVQQQKLRKEILSHTENGHNPNFDELSDLPYLEQVVFESLRLSSLIPQYTKVCTHPTTIELNGKKALVEQGMTIMIPVYQFHHDPKYFPEPETFKPERFDSGAHHEFIRQGQLLPFSDGPRICMGKRLALLTLKSALLHIIGNYQVVRGKERISTAGDSGFGVVLQGDINLEYRRLERK